MFMLFIGMGSCEVRDLPVVHNARRIMVRPFRGSVIKYKCHRHFTLLGDQDTAHCVGHKKWNMHEAPVCARKCRKVFNRSRSSI